ncbi:hypothetical protein Tco_0125671, partial [Tanacetum coccineum]
MRSKRNPKVPQNLEDYVHSINIIKSKNSKNESKNSGKSNEELSKGSQNKRYNVERKCDEYCVEDERINSGGNKDKNESFKGDLNGVQFPPNNGMTEVENGKSEGRKECLAKENNCGNQ